MERRQSTFHLSDIRIAKEKKHLEAQAAKLQPGPERDELIKKLRQLDTASNINQWLSSPGLQAPR